MSDKRYRFVRSFEIEQVAEAYAELMRRTFVLTGEPSDMFIVVPSKRKPEHPYEVQTCAFGYLGGRRDIDNTFDYLLDMGVLSPGRLKKTT